MVLEVITGPMFSGKTEELLRRLRLAKIAGQKVQAFKPSIDTRYDTNCITSHNNARIVAIPVASTAELLEKLDPKTEVIGIDEVQFFDDEIIEALLELSQKGKHIIVSCLNLDFRGEPFRFKNSKRTVAELICRAHKVTKLHAICTYKLKDENGKEKICGREAYFTQRLINGKPAPYNSPVVLVGGKELYEARCELHHEVPGKPKKKGF